MLLFPFLALKNNSKRWKHIFRIMFLKVLLSSKKSKICTETRKQTHKHDTKTKQNDKVKADIREEAGA